MRYLAGTWGRLDLRDNRVFTPTAAVISADVTEYLAGNIIGRIKSRGGLFLSGTGGRRPVAASWRNPYTGRRLEVRATVNLNALIVDDEKPARDELAYLLKGLPQVTVVGHGKNGLEAVALIKEHDPDLIFLDVQMPRLDGFGVIKKLRDRKGRMPHIVFATAYDQYAVQAFEVNAVDYIPETVRQASRGQGHSARQENGRSGIVSGGTPGNADEPAWAAAAVAAGEVAGEVARAAAARGCGRRGVRLRSRMEPITVSAREFEGTSNYRTIEELMSSLDSDRFWRPHRSYLVNIDHIKGSAALVQVELHAENGGPASFGDSGESRADQAAA